VPTLCAPEAACDCGSDSRHEARGEVVVGKGCWTGRQGSASVASLRLGAIMATSTPCLCTVEYPYLHG